MGKTGGSDCCLEVICNSNVILDLSATFSRTSRTNSNRTDHCSVRVRLEQNFLGPVIVRFVRSFRTNRTNSNLHCSASHLWFILTPLFLTLAGSWNYSKNRTGVATGLSTMPNHIHVDAESRLSKIMKTMKSDLHRPSYLPSDHIQQSMMKMRNGNKYFNRWARRKVQMNTIAIFQVLLSITKSPFWSGGVRMKATILNCGLWCEIRWLFQQPVPVLKDNSVAPANHDLSSSSIKSRYCL